MRTEELRLTSRADGNPLSALIAHPEGEPRGLMQIAHGMAEYKERYLPFMEALTGAGYACLISDHRGHGGSVRGKKDHGWFGPAGARGVVEDMYQLAGEFTGRFPGSPLCLFGHSMGSLAARVFAREHADTLSALIVCGCPGQNAAAGLGLMLVKAMRLFMGERHRSKLIDKMINGSFTSKFPDEPSRFCWLNSDPDMVANYENDEQCGFLFTLNGYEALLKLMLSAYDIKGWRAGRPDMPVLFISGGEDPCMMSREGLNKSANKMREAGYSDVSVRVLDGMRHEILLEPNREQAFREIIAFLDSAFAD